MKDNDGWAPVTNSPQVIQPVTTPVLEENEDWSVENAYNPSQPRDDRGRWGEGGFGGKQSIQQGKSPGSAGRGNVGEDFRRVKEDYTDDAEELFKEFQEFQKYKKFKQSSSSATPGARKGSLPGEAEDTLPNDGEDGGGKGAGRSSIDGTKAGAPDLSPEQSKRAEGAIGKMHEFLKSVAAKALPVAGVVAKKAASLTWEGIKGAYNRYGNFGSIATGVIMGTGLTLFGLPATTVAVGVVGAMETRKAMRALVHKIDGAKGTEEEEQSLVGGPGAFISHPMLGKKKPVGNAEEENTGLDTSETDAEQMANTGPLEIPEGLAEYILQFIKNYCTELRVEPPSLTLDDVKEMLATLANYIDGVGETSEDQDGEVPVDSEDADPEETADQGTEEEPVEDEDVSEEGDKPDWMNEDTEEEPKKPVGNISYYGPGW